VVETIPSLRSILRCCVATGQLTVPLRLGNHENSMANGNGKNHGPPLAKSDETLINQLVLAEGEGFEPSRRLPAYTRSRRAPSTTRPPLLHGRKKEAAT
jgi:hypothetical protein